jgi:hypothetical protein
LYKGDTQTITTSFYFTLLIEYRPNFWNIPTILFLFLSVKKTVELENPKVNEERLIAHSFKKMVKLIKDTKLVNRSNIILAHNDYILIAKIIKNDSKFIAGGLDIYVDIIPDGIIISSCKLSSSAKNMKSNTAIIVNHKKNNIETFII